MVRSELINVPLVFLVTAKRGMYNFSVCELCSVQFVSLPSVFSSLILTCLIFSQLNREILKISRL